MLVISELVCTRCFNIFPIPRHFPKASGHIKDLWCPSCQAMRKHIEKGTVVLHILKENYEKGIAFSRQEERFLKRLRQCNADLYAFFASIQSRDLIEGRYIMTKLNDSEMFNVIFTEFIDCLESMGVVLEGEQAMDIYFAEIYPIFERIVEDYTLESQLNQFTMMLFRRLAEGLDSIQKATIYADMVDYFEEKGNKTMIDLLDDEIFGTPANKNDKTEPNLLTSKC